MPATKKVVKKKAPKYIYAVVSAGSLIAAAETQTELKDQLFGDEEYIIKYARVEK